MVVFLLILSALLLLIAVAMYRAPRLAIVSVLGVLAVVGYGVLSFSTRSLMLAFPCLIATWIVCRWCDARRQTFASFAAVSIAAGWIGAMLLFIPRWNEIQQLAADYPVEQMDERLAWERQSLQDRPQDNELSSDARDAVYALDQRYFGVRYGEPDWWKSRTLALATLESTHDDFVNAFISQEGFGLERLGFNTPPQAEYIVLPEPKPIPLPFLPAPSTSAGEPKNSRPLDADPFESFHIDQTVNFADAERFGWSVDNQWTASGYVAADRVRGFQPHAFRELPSGSPAGDQWQLARLELVSLLKHDPPAVYLSEHLPRMQDLASDDVPTRPLNAFETRSLKRLLDGETIVAEENRNRITMLGGLRAARQCLQCHSVDEGHLLGAFSYEFLRKEPLPPQGEKRTPPEPVT